MSSLFTRSIFLMFLSLAVVGCGGDASTGHTTDPTPGGEPTPPVMDDAAMDAYAKEQAKKSGG